MVLTAAQARRLAIHRQGLAKPDAFGRGINGVLRAVQSLRYIQIDTISVVDRAHHHVLKTRVRNYEPKHLDDLLVKRKAVFEYWHHAAAFLPLEDYRFYLPLMRGYAATHTVDKKVAREVLARIKAEGPLMSKDFETKKGMKSSGWWDWKPAKRAMEHLFLSGELMVSGRQGFQKQFDLTERVLPDDVNTTIPDEKERAHFYATRVLAAQGIGRAQDIGYMKLVTARFEKFTLLPPIRQRLQEMSEEGEIVPVPIGKETYYVLASDIDRVPGRVAKSRLVFLSPFDNLVINRDKLAQLFGFDYQIECYVPEKKRKYGYFTLPILLGDQFIGRMDCKAHRAEAKLAINNIWLEPKTRVTQDLADKFRDALASYANDLGCTTIAIQHIEDPDLRKALKGELAFS